MLDDRIHGMIDALAGFIAHQFHLQGGKTVKHRETMLSHPQESIDWFKGKITGKSHISRENLWFPVDFPLSQPIEFKNFLW